MKILRYIWALPNSLVGLFFVPIAVLTRGHVEIVDGVLEIHGGLVSWILKHCMSSRGYVSSVTLGHVVLGQNKESLLNDRRHERAHVKQYEILGPLFIPVYIAVGIYALIRGRGAYKGNYLEQKAIEQERVLKQRR